MRAAARAANVTLDMPRKSWRQAEGLHLRSVKDLDALWDRWVAQRLRTQTVASLTPPWLEGTIKRVRNQGKSTTANPLLAHLFPMLNYALRRQLLIENPMVGIRAT
jgi:hypothetical protein